jgi:lipid II:glycine glycyltransferase (peptidoglycan interpeptide bridge formation enzyme)
MELYQLDPCTDTRWRRFLDRHPDASIFHTPGWLDALRRTYGYQPVVYTTSSPRGEMVNGQVFCRIKSWFTGRRLVSLPFSDHAALLMNGSDELGSLLAQLQKEVDGKTCKYVEIRPTDTDFPIPVRFCSSDIYYWHKLPLDLELPTLFRNFHKNCVQRKIRRAQREKLDYSEGRSETHLQHFYRLLLLTRRRHHLPPQPISWFRNLAECLGEAMKVRIASKNGRPLAAIITLSYKKSMVYKYGASDANYMNLGGMAALLWKTIEEAKSCAFAELDMGRSDCANSGLITFKERWGGQRRTLTYCRYPLAAPVNPNPWRAEAAKRVFALVPPAILPTAGTFLYRHVG